MLHWNRKREERVIRAYFAAVAARDLESIADRFAKDCVLIDSGGTRVIGRDEAIEAHRRFFEIDRDFAWTLERMVADGDRFLLEGVVDDSSCRLAGAKLWRVRLQNDRIAVFETFAEGAPRSLFRMLGMVGAEEHAA